MTEIKVINFNSLKENEIERLDEITSTLTLCEQLWYIARLSDFQVKIFIFRDFETVFFVPFRSKFGFQYAFMPAFLQKLNFVGSNSGINPIINALFKTLRFGEISLTKKLTLNKSHSTFRDRKNYILELNGTYQDLKNKYAKNHIRNCKKAATIDVVKGTDFEGLISIFKSEKKTIFHKKQMNEFVLNLKKMENCKQVKKHTIIFNAFMENSLIASIFLINFNGVLYYILGSSIKSDKNLSSLGLYRLFDYVIELNSNQNLILDFEGSDHFGIARFFEGFGSIQTNYSFLRWNKLPLPFRLFKQ